MAIGKRDVNAWEKWNCDDVLRIGRREGVEADVVTTLNGNVIVNVKETRVAISQEMAQKIMI